MVFGVVSAPALWQRTMDQVLQGLKGCLCMLDNTIVTGVTRDEHLCNLRAVLNRLKQYGLRLNRQKCEFFKDKIDFWGISLTSMDYKVTRQN